MEFKDIAYIVGIILSAVVTFLTTKHKLKELIRDKYDDNNQSIHELKIEVERLKSKDQLQQQIIEQFRDQVLTHLPKMFQIIENYNHADRK